eukprot:GFYU01024491.1.p1 GENE.GFYU01024491.1~~GFYU01024491.1.p1  ORF type:complete len:448 (+),score=95.75 GFYU01024491.1:136-1479(+)
MSTSNEVEITQLRKENEELKAQLKALQKEASQKPALPTSPTTKLSAVPACAALDNEQIRRFSRHLLMPELGVEGQKKLLSSSVLVVGAGGLGSSACLYLAAAGIGRLGIVDFDTVEFSNLQRQIIHTESRIGVSKAQSARKSVLGVNSDIDCVVYEIALNSSNAVSIIEQYDYVLDATDNVATRYLVNDACITCKKPLISGSALQLEGQVTIYGHGEGPCYRCLYPKPPPASMVTNCSDGGVLGVVPGLIGCIQALEAIKLAATCGTSLSGKLMLFDAFSCMFRTVKLRGRNPECIVCGENPSITRDALIDYVEFCGASANDKDNPQPTASLPADQTITCTELHKLRSESSKAPVLIDVRAPIQYDICRLEESQNIPLATLSKPGGMDQVKAATGDSQDQSVYCICRRGVDSVAATLLLRENGFNAVNVTGGLSSWANTVDTSFPQY